MKEKDKYIWYYKQIEENDRNIKRNLEHISNGELKEKPAFIVPEKKRYFDSIRVCKVPELYSNFKINPDYDFVITFKHLYTMQSSEATGFYPHGYDTNYHNMGIELLNELPDLIESPEIILNTISQDKANRGEIPTTLACVLNKEVIKNVDGKEESCPVIAFIEPNMSSEEATVVLSAYPKEQYERFLEDNIKKGGSCI